MPGSSILSPEYLRQHAPVMEEVMEEDIPRYRSVHFTRARSRLTATSIDATSGRRERSLSADRVRPKHDHLGRHRALTNDRRANTQDRRDQMDIMAISARSRSSTRARSPVRVRGVRWACSCASIPPPLGCRARQLACLCVLGPSSKLISSESCRKTVLVLWLI